MRLEGIVSPLTREAEWHPGSGSCQEGAAHCLLSAFDFGWKSLRLGSPYKTHRTPLPPCLQPLEITLLNPAMCAPLTTQMYHMFETAQRDFFTPKNSHWHQSHTCLFNDCNSQTVKPGSNLFNAHLQLGWYPVIWIYSQMPGVWLS